MRTFAVGDVHGCLVALDTLLAQLQLQVDDKLVFLGDLIDRGPESKGVIERVLELSKERPVEVIQGNHEEMLLVSRYEPAYFKAWLNFGGREMLQSYGWDGDQTTSWPDSIPKEHWNFFSNLLVDCVEEENHILVHAAVETSVHLDKQHWPELRWVKWNDPPAHISGKIVVCGHTHQPSGTPLTNGHAVCIDTWVYGFGWLTALELESGKYYQANQRGETRTGQLDPPTTRTSLDSVSGAYRMDRPQNPAGPYVANPSPTPAERLSMIAEIAELPAKLRQVVAGLTSVQLETKYRNWTVRQIVNHLSDSHVNGYVRFKLTLTENLPTIKPYDESGWSALKEPQTTDVQVSLQLLDALHTRWNLLMKNMTDADFQRKYYHPEYKTQVSLGEALGVYSWHGRHHLAQIQMIAAETRA